MGRLICIFFEQAVRQLICVNFDFCFQIWDYCITVKSKHGTAGDKSSCFDLDVSIPARRTHNQRPKRSIHCVHPMAFDCARILFFHKCCLLSKTHTPRFREVTVCDGANHWSNEHVLHRLHYIDFATPNYSYIQQLKWNIQST